MPPPVLLLHGFLGRGADWDPAARRLAKAYRVLALDWADELDPPDPGSVQTAERLGTATPRPGGLVWAADRLAERLDAEGVNRADVAGYSMGGRLALLFALRHPERVQRLVLVSASPGLRTPEERAARRAHDASLARDLAADFPAFLRRWTRQPVFASLTDTQRATLEADRLAHVDPQRAARVLVAMGTGAMPSLWNPMRRLAVETSAITGALDPKYTDLAKAMDRVRGYVLPGAGHALLTEAPDALADLLLYLFA